jgi:hypothetical protein
MSDNTLPSFMNPVGNDVCFEVEGKFFYGKRSILAKKSRFFAIMFSKEYAFKESIQSINEPIHIGNITANAFWIVMNFVSTNTVKGLATIDEAFELFPLAEYLMFPEFDSALQAWIGRNLQFYNVCDVRERQVLPFVFCVDFVCVCVCVCVFSVCVFVCVYIYHSFSLA